MVKTKKGGKKEKRTVIKGKIHILATFNNTFITVADEKNNPLIVGSCGLYGFSGTRKSTPYAATVTAEATLKKAITEYGLKEVDVFVKGIGPGREAALRVVKNSNLDVLRLIDVTPVPHNGVRPPKVRRV